MVAIESDTSWLRGVIFTSVTAVPSIIAVRRAGMVLVASDQYGEMGKTGKSVRVALR
jgi:hypothetical protein